MRKRGQGRWSTLLTSSDSRIASTGIRARLGPQLWGAFVAYANKRFKPSFVALFEQGAESGLHCVGPLGSRGCPYAERTNVLHSKHKDRVASLHLDHAIELNKICAAWLRAMPEGALRSWDDGVEGELVCQLLFGVRAHEGHNGPLWRANVRLRCWAAREALGSCHDTASEHAGWDVTPAQLRWPDGRGAGPDG